MAAGGIREIADYVAELREDGHEAEFLVKDFLIHVTSFFRDPAAFEGLAKTVVAEFVQRSEEQSIRVLVPGCGTGEEAYSLAMLFLEAFAAAKRAVNLQVFASDISADALDFARTGAYPDSIDANVSAERLQRFFTREDHGYRVCRELPYVMVFPEHDLLADPPFFRIDLVSCRNLLIYLDQDEQRKVLSLLHFAVRNRGYLFLGASETIGQLSDYFEPVSLPLRIFRRIGEGRTRERMSAYDMGERARALWPRTIARQRAPGVSEVAQQMLLDAYCPASVLVDRNCRALFLSGPTDRYFRAPPGEPSRDALTMLREGLTKTIRSVPSIITRPSFTIATKLSALSARTESFER